MRFPLAIQSYQTPTTQFENQRLINLYAEAAPPPNASTDVVLLQTPGSDLFCDLGVGPLQGLYGIGQTLYAVSGGILFAVTPEGTKTTVGGIPSTQPYVDFIESPLELLIAAGQHGHIVTLDTGELTTITDTDFPGARSGVFMDGVAVVVAPDSAQSNVSGINDFTQWDPLEFVVESTVKQNILAIKDDRKEFWMFGDKAIIPYTRTGTGGYPFERVTNAILDKNLVAQWSVAVSDNTYFWLGRKKEEGGLCVWRAAGYSPQRVSTHAIEQQMERFSNPQDAIAFTYMLGGHIHYVLNFPGQATFVLDLATNLWHEWNRFGEDWSTFTHHTYFEEKHIVGGADGKLYRLDPALYTHAGETIVRRMISPVFDADGKNIRISRVELELEAGVGLVSGQGSDPKVMLRWSKDGGKTWSNEHWRDVGKMGKYRTRTIWRNLDTAREWVLEFTYSEPTLFSVSKAYAQVSAGRS